jgi:hypothetical protein
MTESTLAMPQIYTDITFDEFLRKVSPNTTLHRRDVVGGEIHNLDLINDMLQTLHELCVEKHGADYRASSGSCYRNQRLIQCRKPGTPAGQEQVNRTCGKGWVCHVFEANNFDNRVVKFCTCVPRTDVSQRNDIGTQVEYEGFVISSETEAIFAEADANWHFQFAFDSPMFNYESRYSSHT